MIFYCFGQGVGMGVGSGFLLLFGSDFYVERSMFWLLPFSCTIILFYLAEMGDLGVFLVVFF
ncbi:hypothetical protein BZA05DRAFT_163290 [Tricharina praecox]|uniref:uncharacterized protein n=1 Tax=Tricharina praecox TaxID=43433 RepID=UPI00221E7EF4|nr:uncharacterized protein BZA05DRAFT_163290 [Tricharina praecox]KAI5856974.1 hypothetical protein BZA05DRAFT_163290 [Tricharina praecox]